MNLCREDPESRLSSEIAHSWNSLDPYVLSSSTACFLQPKIDVCQFFRNTQACRTNLIFSYYKPLLAPE